MNYGEHAPFVIAAYAISIAAISILIAARWLALRYWRRKEKRTEE